MNLANPILQKTLSENRNARLQDLFWDPIEFIRNIHKPRNYQSKIVSDTRRDILKGIHQWRWDVAWGGWKTYMSFAVMKHVVDRWGRVLYLAPWNTELKNAMDSHRDKYCLWEDNAIKFHSEDDIRSITNPRQKKFYDSVPYHYSTGQMLVYDDRYKLIPEYYYDLIIYDESQWFLWNQMSNPKTYFWWATIDMSATPFNNTKHVWSFTPHVYGEVTSEYLIEHHGYPDWRVKNYQIDEWIPEDEIDGDLDFEKNEAQHNLLNINERFLILESIFEEIIISGTRKWLAFMPSVADAQFFVEHIVPNNPLLVWKVDFVAWKCSDKHNNDTEEKLRSWELKIVLCKDKWNRSLDIIDITDIILNDPTRSLERVSQRIFRGARPAPWKEFLRIHDLLSSLFHSEQVWIPAISADKILKRNKISKRYDSSVKLFEDISPEFIAALHRRRSMDLIWVTSKELELRREVKDSFFLSDTDFAIKIFAAFASQVFHIHPYQLLRTIDRYKGTNETLDISFWETKVQLTFFQFLDVIEFYGTYDSVMKYDYLSNISISMWGEELWDLDRSIMNTRNSTVRDIDMILEEKEKIQTPQQLQWLPKTFLWEVGGSYMTQLHQYARKLWAEIWFIEADQRNINRNEAKRLMLDPKKNKELYSYIVWIELDWEVYECWGDVYCQSKDRAKRYAAMSFLNMHRFLFEWIRLPKERVQENVDISQNKSTSESISQDFNNYITKNKGRYKIFFTNVDGYYRCNVVVEVFWKTIKLFCHTKCQGKKWAKDNMAQFFMDNIENILENNKEKEEIFINEGDPESQEVRMQEGKEIKKFPWSKEDSSENPLQRLNHFLTNYKWSHTDDYQQFQRYKWWFSFTCTLKVYLWNKIITVSSDVRSTGKKRAKNKIAQFFLDNIKDYLERNKENTEFTMHKEIEWDQYYGDDVPTPVELGTDLDNVIEAEYILNHSSLTHLNSIFDIMKSKVLNRPTFTSSIDHGIQAKVEVFFGNRKQSFISNKFPYTNYVEKKEAKHKALEDLYNQIKILLVIQQFLRKWLDKKEIKD